mgnify:FL=1
MGTKSEIEWTESTWNPVTGCTKVSPGCANCYAERMARRLKAMGQKNYANGFEVTTQDHMLSRPLEWKKPKMVFVNSMSDLFHEDVPVSFIRRTFDVMVEANRHVFQVLTKRSGRLRDLSESLPWAENIWMGVSVENAGYSHRIDHLRQVPASVRFVSLEPLLGPVPDLDLSDIDWVIVGGESGPGARPMKKGWVTQIRDQAVEAKVPFFFKQWGGKNRKQAGRSLEGQTYDQMPEEREVKDNGLIVG